MDGTTEAASSHHVPAWLVRGCRWLTRGSGWLWSILFNITLNLIATWLFTARDSNFNAFPVTALIQHWPVAAVSLLVFASLTGLAWAIGKLPVIESPRVLKRRYLTYWIYQTQDLAIEGIPLLPPRVQLDEIFIAMQLRPHQSSIDQLLTREQSRLLREGMRHGSVAKEVERVLIDAERQHELLLRKHDRIKIEDLWQHLTREHPAAVIQGYPGMGKSTMLVRLTLYMARRGLGKVDPLEKQVEPIMVPLFIRLGRYASYRQQAKSDTHPSIWNYLASSPKELADLTTPTMLAWLQQRIEHGECLVLFDGLDEVSDPRERFEVQEAIKAFIVDAASKASDAKGYNRFLITSRVAGYDQSAFPGYPHYTIAELTAEQIEAFLPRWCRACVRGDNTMRDATPEEIERQVTRQATAVEEKLKNAIQGHQGIRELVENPFLLTLLAIMQQNGIDLPHRRVELYSTITTVLLETRNARRNLPIIPEAQAIQRLGPVAYQMQETQNSFATRQDVLVSFAKTIEQIEKIPLEQAQDVAEAFLLRVRERGGIFVLRTGDYFGFFHRTFQEYFAARHLLRLLATRSLTIDDLLDKARQQDDLWREPFLLAVAYKTKEEAPGAWEIMRGLLTLPSGADQEQRFHDIVLVGECLVEAKEATIPSDLERDVVLALLEMYEEALQCKDAGACTEVEIIMRRLIQDVSREAEHSPLLLTSQEALLDTQHPLRLQAALTLLSLGAHELRTCADVVFAKLVPPLLGLTGLPEIGPFKPVKPVTQPDFDTIDLALAALSFLGAPGPTGASLERLRPRFEQHLKQLARYSLQTGTLITPAIVPLEEENYQRYVKCVEQWQQLYTLVNRLKYITKYNVSTCMDIHRDLLATAEEICYPAETHLLLMLERSQARPDANWQAIWQDYLHEQMETRTYLDYQVCALLWAVLFSEQHAQQELANVLHTHFSGSTKHQRYAQRFLLRVARHSKHLREQRYLRRLEYLVDSRDARYLEYMGYLTDYRHLKYSVLYKSLRNLISFRDFRYWAAQVYLESLNKLLFTEHVRIEVEQRLHICSETECTELLTLLLGRILQIRNNDPDQEIVQEVQHIIQIASPFARSDSESREVVWDIVRYLPARTKQEITYVLDLAKNAQDVNMQKACGFAVYDSNPATDEAWMILEQAQTSPIAAIREAAEERLERRKREQQERVARISQKRDW